MAAIAFLGDELTAAGYRLAGIDAPAVPPGKEDGVLAAACSRSQVVLVSALVARNLDPDGLRARLAARQPLVMVVPEIGGLQPGHDPVQRARKLLGVGE